MVIRSQRMFVRTIHVFLAALFLLQCGTIALADESGVEPGPIRKEWSGTKADGTKITQSELTGLTHRGNNRVKLRGAKLDGAGLKKASLFFADFSGCDLTWVDFSQANLFSSLLTGADLSHADLTDADLSSADLSGTFLYGTKMSGANLFAAHLNNAIFEPSPGTLPDIQSMASASGLGEMGYENSPTSLVELEQAFRTAGLRLQANEIHFDVMHGRRIRAGFFEKILLLAVEIPCGYGLRPGRPLLFLLTAILAFWIPYAFALNGNGSGGIWLVWSDDRANKDTKTEKDGRLSPVGPRRLGVALYFSVISAFNIGWEEINVGSWIARLQPKEFTLKAVGWVRVVAGVQSLFGVYMVALSILSYFGHIFE
jgi:hypothetical protein